MRGMRGACLHCGAPVDAPAGAPAACGPRCQGAHALLVERGLERAYALAGGTLPRARPPSPRAWLPELLERARDTGLVAVEVEGAGAAGALIIEELAAGRGVACRVDPGSGRLEAGLAGDLPAFLDDVERVGFGVRPERPARGPRDDLFARTVLAVGLAAAAAVLAVLHRGPSALPLLFVVATASLTVAGSWLLRGAARAFARGVPHLDLPIFLGAVVTYGGAVASAILAPDPAPFAAVSVLLALALGARLLARRLVREGFPGASALDGLVVHPLHRDAVGTAAAGAVRAGDRLLILPKEILPVPARLAGHDDVSFSLAWLTGDGAPRAFRAGDTVPAGARLAGGAAAVVDAADDAARSPLPSLLAARDCGDGTTALWGRYATASTVGILLLAAVAGVSWWGAGPARAVAVATAVVLAASPFAAGVAAPLLDGLVAARLRRLGVLVRGPDAVERLLGVDRALLDATGKVVLTEPRLDSASDKALASLDAVDRQTLFDLCARSSHPKSRAVAAFLRAREPSLRLTRVDVEEQPGLGVHARALGAHFAGDALWRGGARLVQLAFVEQPTAESRDQAAALAARGVIVEHTAPGARPDDKSALVRSLGGKRVLFVGDGAGDAPAFAAAGVTAAPAFGRPALSARADFVFLGGGAGPLAAIVDVARSARRAALAAATLSGVSGAAWIALAMAGRMTPGLAAVALPAAAVAAALVTCLMPAPRRP